MSHVSDGTRPATIPLMTHTILHDDETAGIQVLCTVVGPLSNNVFVLRDTHEHTAVLFDAADEPGVLLPYATALDVTHVIETHHHWDHIGAIDAFRSQGIPVLVPKADASGFPSYDAEIVDGDELTVGRFTLRAISTPGHTPGSTCYAVVGQPLLFTGDTLFRGGPGATHFPGGDPHAMAHSLRSRLFDNLDDDTIVYPGHGPQTTLGAERETCERWARSF